MKKLLALIVGFIALPSLANAAILDFSNQGNQSGPILNYNLGSGLSLDVFAGEMDDPDNGGPVASFADMFMCGSCGPRAANQVDGYGLGVGSSNIDTHGSSEDLLILSFSETVRITALSFFEFELDNQQDPGQPDIAHFYTADPIAQTLNHLAGFTGQDNGTDAERFGGLSFTGTDFILNAAELGSGDSDFWLRSIEFEKVDVPTPGTLGLMAIGSLMLIGSTITRRKRLS